MVCAGVWHNIVLASFAGIVVLLLPFLSSLFFEYGTGIQVVAVKEVSTGKTKHSAITNKY